MTGIIFLETLRRKWREMLYWGLGLVAWALYPFLLMPDERGLQQYADLIESFDPAIARAFGISDAISFSTPEGFIGYAFFGYILLILGAYAVLAGLNVTIIEEDRGIMDVFLSLPVPRWQLIAGKMLAYAVMMVGMAFMAFLGLMMGTQISTVEIDISAGNFFVSAMNIVPSTLLMMAFTVFVSTLVKNRAVAAGLAGGFVVVSYIVNTIGDIAGEGIAADIARLSFFHYFDGTSALQNDIEAATVLGLVVVAVLMILMAMGFFQRRDIAV